MAENEEPVDHVVPDQGFIKLFRHLPEKSPSTVRIFDRTDFYTVHDDDAYFAAKELFNTTTVVKFWGSGPNKLAYCSLKKLSFDSFVRKLLLVKQYRVEVWRPKGGSSRTATEWEIAFKGSPGNLTQFEEILFQNNLDYVPSAGVVGIRISSVNNQTMVGIGFVEIASRELKVSEFSDNEIFSNLEAVLIPLNPKECVLNRGDNVQNMPALKKVLERNKILVNEVKKGDFKTEDLERDLNKLIRTKAKSELTHCKAFTETSKTLAMHALADTIKYLELLSDDSNMNQFSISSIDSHLFMRLDATALKALNLFPEYDEVRTNATGSLFGLLNKCRTTQGQRLLGQWLKQPLLDLKKINERLDLVEAFCEDFELRQSLDEDHLRRFPDFQLLAKKFVRKTATLQDCYKVYQSVQRLQPLVDCLEKHEGKHQSLITQIFAQPLQAFSKDFTRYQDMVETTVDLEQVNNREYLIRPDVDPELQKIRETLDELNEDMTREFRKVASDLGLDAGKTLKFESNAQLGHFYRVSRKEEKSIRTGLKKYHTIDTKKDGVRFVSLSLKQLSKDYTSSMSSYEAVQKEVVQEIIQVASGYVEPMYSLGELVAELDVLIHFAVASLNAPTPYVRPRMLERGAGVLRLKEARHPCLEVQDKIDFIPNDVDFKRGSQTVALITGPNMGGKSTYIRMVGVNTLLAQCGCFVPCAEAEISIVDAIFARVGAADCQMKGVSTFMAEMLETAAILRGATKDSLIIIDELGRGTSTFDGFGLAWTITEYIALDIQALCLFATHFHELTAIEDEIPDVKNLHVTALTDNDKLVFLYKVKPGVCDQSFGIHVAELAHFPQDVIEYAKRRAREMEHFFEIHTDEGESDETKAKRKRIEKKEGEKIIDEFLLQLDNLKKNEATMGEEEEDESKRLKNELIQTCQNPFIQGIFSRIRANKHGAAAN